MCLRSVNLADHSYQQSAVTRTRQLPPRDLLSFRASNHVTITDDHILQRETTGLGCCYQLLSRHAQRQHNRRCTIVSRPHLLIALSQLLHCIRSPHSGMYRANQGLIVNVSDMRTGTTHTGLSFLISLQTTAGERPAKLQLMALPHSLYDMLLPHQTASY